MVDDGHVRRARALARVLDTAIAIPGTRIRIGLDPILGLIPGGGDLASAALSAYIVYVAIQRGAPRSVIWRMLGNIGVDTVGGSVPVVGDLFDVAFKANAKNADLLEQYAAAPAAVARRSRWLGALVATAILLVLVAIAVVGFLVARLLWRLLTA